MKNYKKILLVLAGLLLLVIIGIAIFINSLKPDYGGEKTLSGLSNEVTTYFDPYGIPHIYADNETDAIRALGYVHAQDRLWQMELLRRVAKGQLSEVFGADMIKTDKFFLSLGIADHTKETIAALDMQSEAIKLSQAYLDGINEFIKNGPTPIEFYLTGIEKKPFTIEDVYNAVGYMAFSFAMAHKTDPLLTSMRNKLGEEYIDDLAVHSDTSTVWIKNFKGVEIDTLGTNITASVTAALDKLPIPQFEGSNSWVVAPQKTKNGKVILANDPHIGFAQPSVWYEAHVSTPAYEKYGYHLAGVPFPLLGHDRKLAYGFGRVPQIGFKEQKPLESKWSIRFRRKVQLMGDFWIGIHRRTYCIVDTLCVPHDSINGFLFHQTNPEQIQGNRQCLTVRILYRFNLFFVEFAVPLVQFGGLTNFEYHSHQYLAQRILLCHFCVFCLFIFWVLRTHLAQLMGQ